MGSLVPKNNIINYYFFDKNEQNPVTGKPKRKAIPLKNPATGEPLRPKNRDDQRIAKELKKEYDYKFSKVTTLLKSHYPFKKAFDDFLDSKKKTSASYKDVFKVIKNDFIKLFGEDIFVREIDKTHVDKLSEYWTNGEKKLSRNSVISYLIHLRIFFIWLQKNKAFDNIIPVEKGLSIEEKEIVVIPQPEIKLLLDFFEKHDINQYRMFKFLYMTGFRTGEACALLWEQIDFQNKAIRFQNIKGKRIDDFPLYKDLEIFLKSFKKESGKVFIYKSTDGARFFEKHVKRSFTNKKHPLYNKLSRRYSLHDIRRTFASDLVSNGADIYSVKKLLRHRNIKTTEKSYARMHLNTLSQTAQALSKKRKK